MLGGITGLILKCSRSAWELIVTPPQAEHRIFLGYPRIGAFIPAASTAKMFGYCQKLAKPFCRFLFGREIAGETEQLTDLDWNYLQDAAETRLESGVVFPCKLTDGSLSGVFTIATDFNKSEFWDFYQEHGQMLHLLALATHPLVRPKSVQQPVNDNLILRSREADALLYLAQGLRYDRIAEAMDVAIPTVKFHLANARKKLHAATREQALAKRSWPA